jgi:hypothetical protein
MTKKESTVARDRMHVKDKVDARLVTTAAKARTPAKAKEDAPLTSHPSRQLPQVA